MYNCVILDINLFSLSLSLSQYVVCFLWLNQCTLLALKMK